MNEWESDIEICLHSHSVVFLILLLFHVIIIYVFFYQVVLSGCVMLMSQKINERTTWKLKLTVENSVLMIPPADTSHLKQSKFLLCALVAVENTMSLHVCVS